MHFWNSIFGFWVTFGLEVGEGSVRVGLVHLGVQTQAGGVVSDGLLEVFALDGLVALDSLGLCHLFSPLLVNRLFLVVKIRLVVLKLLLVGFSEGF